MIKMRRRILSLLFASLLGLTPVLASAAEVSSRLDLSGRWEGLAALALFVLAYVLVATEEFTELRKSKPVVLAAGLIWGLIALGYALSGIGGHVVEHALATTVEEFAELFLFLLVAMTYVNAMTERNVFEALRGWLAHRGFSYRQLFWITGLLAFFISPFLDNLTTALVLSAVVLAVGADNRRFIALACINIVVGANAGGAYSPFGDITTLMVWQAGTVSFDQFFMLFVPAAVNFLVPAIFMHFAVPRMSPPPASGGGRLKRGAFPVIGLFAATVATAVAFHRWLALPPFLGMMMGLGYLQFFMYYLMQTDRLWQRKISSYRDADQVPPPHLEAREPLIEGAHKFNIFSHVASAEWDTLLFFYGVIVCVGGLGFIGYLGLASHVMYVQWGATAANVVVGVLSAVVDNIPIMAAVIHMNPLMNHGQWLLVTLTAGVGGSLLSIGSAAGVALMGQARGAYTFMSHLRWTPAIALGYAASILMHLWINAALFH